MIQVCSRCGTRWNVRERQRLWCPRCQGALLAPSSTPQGSHGAQGSQGNQGSSRDQASQRDVEGARAPQRASQRTPSGYRWIAVRPGSAPPPFHGPKILGPTPRYAATPRWGMVDPSTMRREQPEAMVHRGPSAGLVRVTLVATGVVFGLSALVFAARYALMIINRSILLPPLVGDIARWAGVIFAVLSFAAVPTLIVGLAAWLIGRRSRGYAHRGQQDPRSALSIWLGCLLPFANLLLAPVFVIETATEEARYTRMRKLIIVWWILWVVSTAVSVFATATAFPDTTQGYADNTLTTTIAYLLALGVVVLTYRVVMGFEHTRVEQTGRRWVMISAGGDAESVGRDAAVDGESSRPATDDEKRREEKSAPAVESKGQEPAALAV